MNVKYKQASFNLISLAVDGNENAIEKILQLYDPSKKKVSA